MCLLYRICCVFAVLIINWVRLDSINMSVHENKEKDKENKPPPFHLLKDVPHSNNI